MPEFEADRFVARGAAEYGVELVMHLPPGRAWPREPDSVLVRFLYGVAEPLAEVDQRAADLLVREAYPGLAYELLADWERVCGLPDPCVPVPLTLEERRNAVVQKLAARGGQSRAYFLGIAEALGYEGVSITEFSPFVFGISGFGDAFWTFGSPTIRFYWRVNVPGPRLTWLRFGLGMFGRDPHCRILRAEDLECIFDRLKPAHTDVIFNYSGA